MTGQHEYDTSTLAAQQLPDITTMIPLYMYKEILPSLSERAALQINS